MKKKSFNKLILDVIKSNPSYSNKSTTVRPLISNFVTVKDLSYIYEQAKNFNQIDLSNKSLELVCVADTNIEMSIESVLNCMRRVKFKKVKFFTSKTNEIKINEIKDKIEIVNISPLTSMSKYNYFLLNNLPDYIEEDHILIVQHDGTIVYQEMWSDEFLNYDYIGAPWPKRIVNNLIFLTEEMKRDPYKYLVGNGGFCLRSKDLCEYVKKYKLISPISYEKVVFEDQFICNFIFLRKYLEEHNISFSPYELAKRFSYEFEVENSSDKFFGLHSTKRPEAHKFILKSKEEWEKSHDNVI